ncbi:MAG: hypothetical protein ABGW81_01440 [Paracoccaceae bacterium]
MKTGVIISAFVHGILLVLVFLEPRWKSPPRNDAIIINQVTIISEAEFDASRSDSPVLPDQSITAMEQPLIEVDEAAMPDATKAPEATAIDITEAPSEKDVGPDLSAAQRISQTEVVVAIAQPDTTNVLPQISPVISFGERRTSPSPLFLTPEQPRSAPRVANFSTPALPTDARVSDRSVEATAPDEGGTAPAEENVAEAPPESVTEIVPDALPDIPPSAAPPRATSPVRRSENVARTAKAIEDAMREAVEAEIRETVEAAIRELQDAAVAEEAAKPVEQPPVALSGGQRQGIIEAVSRNWNKSIVIGKENYEDLVIVLEVSVAPNGMIIRESIKPVTPATPSGDFIIAYDAARRSVLRAEVIPLPAGQFPEGVRLVLTFNPALNEAGFN